MISARREIPAAKAPWGPAAIPDRPVRRGFRGLLAQGVTLVRQDRRDLRDRKVCPDLREFRALPDQ